MRVLSAPMSVFAGVLAVPLLLCSAAPPIAAQVPECASGIIETVAGGAIIDNCPATEGSLAFPHGIAVAPDGSLYIADSRNARVRKVDPAGRITTVAGSDRYGFEGDRGPATEARLAWPVDVALGADGSLYIADQGNARIRKVGPDGIITTVAGDGARDPVGRRRFAGEGGPAAEATLHGPSSVAVDAGGNVYMTDLHRILKVDAAGIINTIAGGGEGIYSGDGGPASEASLNASRDVVVAPDGSLYIADANNNRVRKISPDGIITTIAGPGDWKKPCDDCPATEAHLSQPSQLALAADGSLYVADNEPMIRKIDPAGIIATVAGVRSLDASPDGVPATEARLWPTSGLAVGADGSLYISQGQVHCIRKVDPDGIIGTVAGGGVGDGGAARAASLVEPTSVAFGPEGSLYVADARDNRVRRIDGQGVITTVAGNGQGGYWGDGGPATEACLNNPRDIAFGPDGSLYIADRSGNRVRRVDPAGVITTVAGGNQRVHLDDGGPATDARVVYPVGVAVGADGSIYIAQSRRVRKVGADGIITTLAGTDEEGHSGDNGPAAEASLDRPEHVAVGPDGSVYIADGRNHRIRKVSPDGIITTVIGTGESGHSGDGGDATEAAIGWPNCVTMGPDGSLYVADSGTRVRRVDPTGVITTIAGDGLPDYWGDGGSALAASPGGAADVAVAHDGSLYIADSGNRRIRRVRWLSCDRREARTRADQLRAKAGKSPDAWREATELYITAAAWDDALAAAERLAELAAPTDEMQGLSAQFLIVRICLAKGDHHGARRRLIPILARAERPMVLRRAGEALVNLYLLRGERDQAVATLEDLRLRSSDLVLSDWIEDRLKQILGQE